MATGKMEGDRKALRQFQLRHHNPPTKPSVVSRAMLQKRGKEVAETSKSNNQSKMSQAQESRRQALMNRLSGKTNRR